MGNAFKKFRSTLAGMSHSQSRIVMVGLDNSGKTTILYRIKLNEKVGSYVGFSIPDLSDFYSRMNPAINSGILIDF